MQSCLRPAFAPAGVRHAAPAGPRRSRGQLQVRGAAVLSEPATLDVKTLDGGSAGSAQLQLRVAEPDTARGLVHRYLVTVRQNARAGTASTLTRSEVSGGGKKPYRQKGTGNARRGTSRTPLRPGGGVAFGPKPRDWSIDMNKKEKRLALSTALQSAAGDIVVVDSFAGVSEVKTKGLLQKLEAVGVPSGEKALLVVAEDNAALELSARNVRGLEVNSAAALKVYDVLNANRIVVEKAALDYLNEWFGASGEAWGSELPA